MDQMHIDQRANDLRAAAIALSVAADAPGASGALRPVVAGLEETARVLSASLYKLADDAVPTLAQRRRLGPAVRVDPARGLSREQEVRVVSTLHDLAGAFSLCASSCDKTREIAVPLIAATAVET